MSLQFLHMLFDIAVSPLEPTGVQTSEMGYQKKAKIIII